MTAKRLHPMTRAECEQTIARLRQRVMSLTHHTIYTSSVGRQIAGTKAAINVMQQKLDTWDQHNGVPEKRPARGSYERRD